MNKTQRMVNILLGTLLCIGLFYACWQAPTIIGVDVSLDELAAQDSSVMPKVWIWRIISSLVVLFLFARVVRKNLPPKQ